MSEKTVGHKQVRGGKKVGDRCSSVSVMRSEEKCVSDCEHQQVVILLYLQMKCSDTHKWKA